MDRLAPRWIPALAMIAMLSLAACRLGSAPSAAASDQPTPATAEPTPTSGATPTTQPSSTPATATETPVPSATASTGADGLAPFVVVPNAAADALFLDRDECENKADGYRVEYPDEWWTNTAVGEVGPCAWFSPTFYQVPDPSVVPDEIAITITLLSGDSGSVDEVISREAGLIGRTQAAVRVEYRLADGGRRYVYQVQLGPTPEEGPNLLAETSTAMAGDYELNKAVLDRIMATMELLGSVQSDL